MMFWIILSVVLVGLIIWSFYIKPYRYWKNLGVPQTNPCIFLGDMWPTLCGMMNIMDWMNWIYYMHPKSKLMGMYQFYKPIFWIKDPEMIKQLAVKDFDHFTDHKNFAISEEVDPLWSKNLFSLKGQKWRDMRALLSGSFTSSKMRNMYGLISDEAKKFVNYFLKENKDFLELDLKDKFTRYTNDVIATTSFGIKVDSLENPDNEFFRMGREVSNFSGIVVLLKFIGVMICPWVFKLFKIGFISKRVSTFFTVLIEETIKTREEQGIVRPDMINLMLEVKKGLKRTDEKDIPDSGFAVVKESLDLAKPHKKPVEITNIDITSQAMIFFLAGFDSVATAMCYTCYELALNTDIQDKLREEIKEIFEETDGKPSYEIILGMKYMDMVVTESLRKWPVGPAVDRVCVKPYTLKPMSPGDPTITFRKGDLLWIPIYNILHDPQYFADPEKFNPERFSEENKGKINPYTYLPFGIGPRACIGSRFALLEVKSVLFHLLNSFEIVPTEKTRIPLKFNKTGLTLAPVGGFPLGLKRV